MHSGHRTRRRGTRRAHARLTSLGWVCSVSAAHHKHALDTAPATIWTLQFTVPPPPPHHDGTSETSSETTRSATRATVPLSITDRSPRQSLVLAFFSNPLEPAGPRPAHSPATDRLNSPPSTRMIRDTPRPSVLDSIVTPSPSRHPVTCPTPLLTCSSRAFHESDARSMGLALAYTSASAHDARLSRCRGWRRARRE
jgi:hypothetical protein